jgi:hypothetical protein
MTERNQHFDKDPDLQVSAKLSTDLRALCEPKRPSSPEVDRAISDRIHRHFVGEKPLQIHRRRSRWSTLGKVAATAAVILIAFSLDLTKQPEPTTNRNPVPANAQAADIDLNGRVDILDAFTLARQIENTSHTETNWDMNGDGRVDHSDVDIVALAAVRLDKGVL